MLQMSDLKKWSLSVCKRRIGLYKANLNIENIKSISCPPRIFIVTIAKSMLRST